MKRRMSDSETSKDPKRQELGTEFHDDDFLTKRLGSTPLFILVGPERRRLFVHEELIRIIPFFNRLVDELDEAKERTVELPDEDIDTINLLLKWLYRGLEQDRPDLDALVHYVRLFLLAEKWSLAPLKSASFAVLDRTLNPELDPRRWNRGTYLPPAVVDPEKLSGMLVACYQAAETSRLRYFFVQDALDRMKTGKYHDALSRAFASSPKLCEAFAKWSTAFWYSLYGQMYRSHEATSRKLVEKLLDGILSNDDVAAPSDHKAFCVADKQWLTKHLGID